jgi:hypothetical protein
MNDGLYILQEIVGDIAGVGDGYPPGPLKE